MWISTTNPKGDRTTWLVFSRWFQFRNKWFQRGDVSVVFDLSTLKPLGDLFPEWVKQPA